MGRDGIDVFFERTNADPNDRCLPCDNPDCHMNWMDYHEDEGYYECPDCGRIVFEDGVKDYIQHLDDLLTLGLID